VVANIAGSAADIDGNVRSYAGGHYLTAVGYSYGGTMVRIADPADPRGYGVYWMTTAAFAHWIALRGYSA
jgi:hypothetical protein